MSDNVERLDFLIKSIKKSEKIPLITIIQNFEEAVVLSLIIGQFDNTRWLIEKYLNFFVSPIPFEIEFFCTFHKLVSAWRAGNLDEAEGLAQEAMKLAEDNGNSHSMARASMALGVLCTEKSKYKEAFVYMKKAEAGLREERGFLLARSLNWLGQITSVLELYQQSWSYYTEALSLNEELSLRMNQGHVFSNMGLLCMQMGLFNQAEECFRNSMEIQEETGNNYGLADSMANLGMLLLKNNKLYEEAAPLLERASIMQFENNAFSKAGLVLVHYAVALFYLGKKGKADCLFNMAERLIFLQESWDQQIDYCELGAELCLLKGDLEEAENLVLRGKEIVEKNNGICEGGELSEIHSKILFEKGEYALAYSQLLLSVEKSKKIDAVKIRAMESVINTFTETARTKKTLARIEEETKALENNNAVLKLSEQRFRKLVNSMDSVAVLATNSEGIVTFWSNTCEEFYGYSADEALGVSLFDLIIPEHLEEWFSGFIRDRKITKGFDVNLVTKDNTLKSVLVSLIPLNENETFLVQIDLTSQRQAENQRSLIEAQMRRTQKLEALGTLAGGIAHDFNNLLQGILGNASMLCYTLEKDSTQYTKAERIQAAAERSADLCSQMLDYAGIKPVGHELLKINEVISDISILLESSLPKGVVLVTDFTKNLPRLMGDRSQIRQVIMNLIINAAESIEGVGQVQISTDFVFMSKEQFEYNLLEESPEEGNYLLFEVSDTGSGIDPATLTRIFDPFFSTKKTGRGLGLAAVLGIIKGHSGAIMVDSNPGIGTKFSVYLRSTAEKEVPIKERQENFVNKDFSGKKILVVDDEEIVRETIHAILSLQGYKVDAVEGGAEALEVLKRGEVPDLMLLDLTMPGLDGAEVFTRLRNMGMSFPVLVASGYSKEKISSLFPDKGPDGFLQKPFTAETLQNKLIGIFNKL